MDFEPIQITNKVKNVSIPNTSRHIELSYENEEGVEASTKEATLHYLKRAYEYALSILGQDGLIGEKNHVKFKKKGRHSAIGIDMHINTSRIKESIKYPAKLENVHLEQSLILHEIIHHLVEEEHLPMLLEMIYMKEMG